MSHSDRKNGISVLLPTQNEEAIVSLCILSFFDFADEIVVVDNGSIDNTKLIVQDLKSKHPKKIKFFDEPTLLDLPYNRQYAFEKSIYKWIVRADSDYVAYTSGNNNILHFREFLLRQASSLSFPKVYAVPQTNVTGDFWHTGLEHNRELGSEEPGRYVPPPFIPAYMMRIYEYFPGFRFCRLGRWEGVSNQDFLAKNKIPLEQPLWMQCNVKSNLNYLFRSERTNWREKGDFDRYPTLESYLTSIILKKYGTESIEEASRIYFNRCVMPFLQEYEPEIYGPYPTMVASQMKTNPIYKIRSSSSGYIREFIGLSQNF